MFITSSIIPSSTIFIPSSAMATKRKTREQEPVNIENKKRAKMEDRLSNLPESLQIHILASLDAKHAVQTSLLSKTWISMYTQIPVLQFNSFSFNKVTVFDKFVCDVLRHRDHSAKLERLTFNRTSGSCSAKTLTKVFYYAFSLGVEQLSVYVQQSRNKTWPIYPFAFESLKSLKLESHSNMSCPFLGPTSRSFKNLTDLHLQHAFLKDPDPFSGFPVLESLTLINCHLCMESESKTLSIHALRLTDLTISSLWSINCCYLTTPRLKFFNYQGHDFPLLRTHEDLPVLEKVVIDFNGVCYQRQEKLMFDNLMAMFCSLKNVKSLTLFSSIVQLLSFFPDELVRRSSPFGELKELKMDFRYLLWQNLFERICMRSFETFQVPLDVKSYLLHNSPDANFTFTYPISIE